MKPIYRKSWSGNLLVWSDLTLGPSFKVKRWFTGLVSCLSGGYNLHRFSDALGVVTFAVRFHLHLPIPWVIHVYRLQNRNHEY